MARHHRQSLVNAARDYIWLYDKRHGMSLQAMADRDNVNVRRIRSGIERAEAADAATVATPLRPSINQPPLVLLFPCVGFGPSIPCPHRGPIRRGSILCCAVCHKSGVDGHPALLRDPTTDPKCEPPKEVPRAADPAGDAKETRRVKRLRKWPQGEPAQPTTTEVPGV